MNDRTWEEVSVFVWIMKFYMLISFQLSRQKTGESIIHHCHMDNSIFL